MVKKFEKHRSQHGGESIPFLISISSISRCSHHLLWSYLLPPVSWLWQFIHRTKPSGSLTLLPSNPSPISVLTPSLPRCWDPQGQKPWLTSQPWLQHRAWHETGAWEHLCEINKAVKLTTQNSANKSLCRLCLILCITGPLLRPHKHTLLISSLQSFISTVQCNKVRMAERKVLRILPCHEENFKEQFQP